jgi:hypothetical protein
MLVRREPRGERLFGATSWEVVADIHQWGTQSPQSAQLLSARSRFTALREGKVSAGRSEVHAVQPRGMSVKYLFQEGEPPLILHPYSASKDGAL